MGQPEQVKIIKHQKATPLKDHGDILFPFENWESTSTGGGWYSKIPEEFYLEKSYLPLTVIHQNPWQTLKSLRVQCFDLQEMVQYTCPYNGYVHYWTVPVIIFVNNIKFWLKRYNIPMQQRYLDNKWMRINCPPKTKKGLTFTKIQRALLGPGFTEGTCMTDGNAFLYDAIVALDNEDYLGVKVWMWFNK